MPRSPRSLRAASAHRFSSYARACGAELARRGKVVVVVRRGSPAYDVRVGRESVALVRAGPKVHASCSCPLFTLGLDGCRHLWASLVVLDRVGAFRPLLARAAFDLVPDRARP
jgi:hypothetical protein